MSQHGKRRHFLVEVIWNDAASNHGWYGPSDFSECSLVTVKTVGYLLRRNRKDVAVAQGVSEHDKYSEVWVIPSASVVSIHRRR